MRLEHGPHSCENFYNLNITEIALLQFNTLESIATPCSVKANGLAPPKNFFDVINFCDTSN
jgi:hypothetical protein